MMRKELPQRKKPITIIGLKNNKDEEKHGLRLGLAEKSKKTLGETR